MMKKNMANMQGSLADMKGRLAGAAGRPGLGQNAAKMQDHAAKMQQHAAKMQQHAAGRPGSPGLVPIGSTPSSFTPGKKIDPELHETFANNPSGTMQLVPPRNRYPSGTQFTNKPMQSNSGPMYGMKKGGKVKSKKMMDGGMAYSKGGSASSRADGIARKGKTRGKMK